MCARSIIVDHVVEKLVLLDIVRNNDVSDGGRGLVLIGTGGAVEDLAGSFIVDFVNLNESKIDLTGAEYISVARVVPTVRGSVERVD